MAKTIDKMADPIKKLTVEQKKNFIKLNILNVKRFQPTEPKQRYVDTRYGDTHDLRSSGLLPIYVHKKNYGKARFVVVDTKTATDVETETMTERCRDGNRISKIPSSYRYIDKEERKMLLDGMKQKWEETMKRFQGLPFLTDTLPKAKKKARMERELQQLEKDIAIIEQHPHIYVCDDNDE